MPVLELAFVRGMPVLVSGGWWFPTVTKYHKSRNQKAIPVLERGSALTRMGTRTKTGSASFRTGNFLIRGLTLTRFTVEIFSLQVA